MTEERTEYDIEEFKRLKQAESSIGLVTQVIVLALSTACFFGLRDIIGGRGVLATILPAVVAVCGGLLLSRTWHALFRSTPLSPHSHIRARLVGFATILTLIGMAYSAWPVATKIGETTAIEANMKQWMILGQTALLTANQRVDDQLGLVSSVEGDADKFETASKNEALTGAIGGGARGIGPVALALAAVANQFNTIADQQKASLRVREDVNENAQDLIRSMQGIIADAGAGVTVRQQKFATLAAKLSDAILTIENIDLAAPLGSLSASVSYRATTVAGVEAIKDAARSAAELARDLVAQAARRRTVEKVTLRTFEPINPGAAVVEYFDDVMPAWAIAFGFDSIPLLLLCILVTIHISGRTPPRLGRPWGEPDGGLYVRPARELDSSNPPGGSGEVVQITADRKRQGVTAAE